MKKIISLFICISLIIGFMTDCKKVDIAKVPSISTLSVVAITTTTAASGGNISSDGGAPITVKGVCWSNSANPTIADSKTNDGEGSGAFISNITGLTSGTTYHVRAYATNSAGTAYGADVSFSTQGLSTITTSAITSITSSTATAGGSIISDGGLSITARGVCWSTSDNPTTADSKTTNGTGLGLFTSNITGLTIGTTYHVRAYATNSIGTAYGVDVSFTTPGYPTITTSAISLITSTTASAGGNVLTDGGNAVLARGVCWSISTNPTISDSKTNDGTGTSSFISSITGLTLGTNYHVRAYATNSVGTVYGADVSFTTLNIPTVTTKSISALSTTTATFGGNIIADGGAAITAKGVCWNTSQNPSIVDSHTIDGLGNDDFISNLTSLATNTTYYVRAYAFNSVGYAYGDEVSFKTLNSNQIIDIDVNVYNTVTIGSQVWMKENLKVIHYRNGDALVEGFGLGTIGSYGWSNGTLYNFYAIVDSRELCPTGWHVPTDTEWTTLETFLGGASFAGGKLKEVGITHWKDPNTGADNSSGFTAIPTGYWKHSLTYGYGRDTAFLWSATEATSGAWVRLIKNNITNTIRSEKNKDWSLSVRCLKD